MINPENVFLKTLLVIYPNNKKKWEYLTKNLLIILLLKEYRALQELVLVLPQMEIMILIKRLTNVGAPISNNDSPTKKYVDDTSSGPHTSSQLTVDSNIDMKDTYRITNLSTPLDGKDPVTKIYVDNTFVDRDGSYPMKGNLNMDNNQILNIPAPTGPKQPTPLAFTDMKYLHVAGTNKMTNNLNMDNKKIINLRPCLLYTSPSPRDGLLSRMPSSA